MMFQGSGNLGKMEFIRLVESNGGLLNGSTRFDFTNYFQVVPSHVLEPVLWAEADRMRGLNIDADNLKNQQEVVKNEVKVNVLNQPYGSFPWIDLPMAANENWYNSHNFYGDLEAPRRGDARRCARVLQDVLLAEQRRTRGDRRLRGRPDQGVDPEVFRQHSAGEITGAAGSARAETAEGKARRAHRSARQPTGAGHRLSPPRSTSRPSGTRSASSIRRSAQGADSLLYDQLVRKQGLTGNVNAGINWGLGNMFDYSGPMLWIAQFFHDTSTPSDKLLAAIDSVIETVRKEGLDQATLDRARVKMRSDLYANLEQFAGFGRANLLASFALFDDDPSRINRLEEEFGKVTPDVVRKTAQEYLRSEQQNGLCDQTREEGCRQRRAAMTRSRAQNPHGRRGADPRRSVCTDVRAAEREAAGGGPGEGFHDPDAAKTDAAERHAGDHGVRSARYRRSRSELVVGAANVHEQKEEVWLADLTGSMMREGTTTLTADAVAREFAAMGGELGINVGPDTTSVSADVISERAADAVRLLADVVQRPRLPDTELARVKGNLLRNLAIQRSTPQSIAQEQFAELVYGEHPYGRLFPTEAMLKGYTIDQVKAFHKNNYSAGRARLYVAGIFDAAAVEAAVRKAFEGWDRGAQANAAKVPAAGDRRFALLDRADAPQSTVLLGLRVPSPSHKDWIALQVTDSLLGGSFASRITSNIREQKGYTYSPFSTCRSASGAGELGRNG